MCTKPLSIMWQKDVIVMTVACVEGPLWSKVSVRSGQVRSVSSSFKEGSFQVHSTQSRITELIRITGFGLIHKLSGIDIFGSRLSRELNRNQFLGKVVLRYELIRIDVFIESWVETNHWESWVESKNLMESYWYYLKKSSQIIYKIIILSLIMILHQEAIIWLFHVNLGLPHTDAFFTQGVAFRHDALRRDFDNMVLRDWHILYLTITLGLNHATRKPFFNIWN